MRTYKSRKVVLQLPQEAVRDGDGYYLFKLPLKAYIQGASGEPVEGRYIELIISKTGRVKKREV